MLSAAKDYLERHDSASPRLEAELLMAFVLKVSRVDLYVQFERPLTTAERETYKEKIRARARGVPIQYITGEQGFRRAVLKVTPAVLIPRPETEQLVDVVIERLKLKGATAAPGSTARQGDKKSFDILDVGTGSGAIAVSLAFELRNVRLWALDISDAALAVAKENAQKYGLLDRITFFKSDLFAEVDNYHTGKFSVIVANLPYVAVEEMGELPKEVCREPWTALAGGHCGLDFFRRVGSGAKRYLEKEGFLALEIAANQALEVTGILQQGSFSDIQVIKDYAGRDRIVLAWRN